MKKINRVGEKNITNEGYVIEIIEYFNPTNITVKFNNSTIVKNIQYSNLVRGAVKNPYHKSVLCIGYFGIGKYSSKTHLKIYHTWNSMLQRCYNIKYQERFPTYKGCSVCESWHNFQNFGKWFEENYKESFDLDKDILIKDNKIYSPATCTFVPHEINTIFTKSNNSRGKYPIGVCKIGNKFRACFTINRKTINLGTFNTPKEAFYEYKLKKEKQIKELAEKWKPFIKPKVYTSLINYQVEIDD